LFYFNYIVSLTRPKIPLDTVGFCANKLWVALFYILWANNEAGIYLVFLLKVSRVNGSTRGPILATNEASPFL